MKVSIIIAAFDIEKYIGKCLDSAINQTLKDIEIIVVNDGSSDRTLEIIENFAKQDNRVTVINQENKGILKTRKIGLDKASGEYILFVDGDDWLELNALEILYKKAKNENLDLLMFNAFKAFDNKKNPFYIINDIDSVKKIPMKSFLNGDLKPAIWAKFIRNEYIKNININFDLGISFGDDIVIVSYLLKNNSKVGAINECLYNYYQRETSITRKIGLKVLEVDKALECIKNNLKESNMFDKYKLEYEYMYFKHIIDDKFLNYKERDEIHKCLNRQYRNQKINIKKNSLISNHIKKYPLSLRIRIKLYMKHYNFGRAYDSLRLIIKQILGSNRKCSFES